MTSPAALPSSAPSHDHWDFLRDVLVFQLKMLLDNLRDLALMPVALVAALIDFFFKGERQGALFYQVLRWGAHSEQVINVYGAVEAEMASGINPEYTVDAVVGRLEEVLARECAKGGTAASVKAAMDQAIAQLHKGTSVPRDLARNAVARAAEKWRTTVDREPPES